MGGDNSRPFFGALLQIPSHTQGFGGLGKRCGCVPHLSEPAPLLAPCHRAVKLEESWHALFMRPFASEPQWALRLPWTGGGVRSCRRTVLLP